MSTIDEMLAIVNAAKSVPELEAKIAQLEAERDENGRAAQELARLLNQSQDTAHNLSDKIASLEVERDSYGFRAIDAEDKLAKLGSILGVGLAKAEPVISDPNSGPKAEPSTEPAGPITPAEGVELTKAPAQDNVGGEGAADPTVSSTQEPALQNAPTMSVKSAAIADTSISATDFTTTHSAEGIATLSVTPAKPFLDAPYWEKPSSMTWGEWSAKGGRCPPWYTTDTDAA